MSIETIINITVELSGQDYSTQEPDQQRIVLSPSPAQTWMYQVIGGADNYFLVSQQNPSSYLWLDPTPSYGANSTQGATFILKGSTLDVGVAISSTNPSLIPVATWKWPPTIMTFGAPQYQIDLNSSANCMLRTGWF